MGDGLASGEETSGGSTVEATEGGETEGDIMLRIKLLTSESLIKSGIEPNRKHPKNITMDIKIIAIASSMTK